MDPLDLFELCFSPSECLNTSRLMVGHSPLTGTTHNVAMTAIVSLLGFTYATLLINSPATQNIDEGK